jgi:hypothetical protein
MGADGVLLVSALMVSADSEEIIGLAGAEVFHRQSLPREPTVRRRKGPANEAEKETVWERA